MSSGRLVHPDVLGRDKTKEEQEEKYGEYTNEAKHSKDAVKACRENGLSFAACIKIKEHEENYTVVITGNHRAEPEIYLVDTAAKMGEGADAYILAAYHLKSGVKVAARVLNSRHARKARSQIHHEMITRLMITKRFYGLYQIYTCWPCLS